MQKQRFLEHNLAQFPTDLRIARRGKDFWSALCPPPVIWLLVGIAFVAGCKGKEAPNPAKAMAKMPVHVEVAPVRVAPLEQTVSAVGSISSPQQTNIASQVGGKIVFLNIRQGQVVPRGTVLARLDAGTQQAAVQAARAALANAQQIYKRDQQLVGIGGVSAQQLQSEQAAVRQARAQLDQARAGLQYTVIQAPFTGELGLRQISLGAYVAPGTPLVSLRSINPLHLDFDLPQQEISRLKVGQNVRFDVSGLPGEFSGRVSTIDTALNPNARAIHVQATVPNPERRLKPGMFAAVHLVVGHVPNALFVPTQAIVPEGQTRRVWVLGPGNQPAPRTVTVGLYQNNWVQVLSGLRPGERVLAAGMEKLHPKAHLIITPYQPIHNQRLDLSNPAEATAGAAS